MSFDPQTSLERKPDSFISANTSNVTMRTGTIVTFNPASGIYQIALTLGGKSVYGISILEGFSSMLGMQANHIYTAGTPVLMLCDPVNGDSMHFIVGALSNKFADKNYCANMVGGLKDKDLVYAFGSSKSEKEKEAASQTASGSHGFSDVVVGEWTAVNTRGVGLVALTNTAKLIASGLSKVECFTMDDMVRIISNTFKHVTAFGDFDIYNDNGRLNAVWKGSSLENETFNQSTVKSSKQLNPDAQNVPPLGSAKDRYYAEYKSRFASYIGKLGNVINCFISDPRPILQTVTDKLYTARGRFHINEDGSILLQSLGDIILTKSVVIPTPKETELPGFTKNEIQARLDEFETWEPGAAEDPQTMLYKWKNYNKWFTNYYSMAEYWTDNRHDLVDDEARYTEGLALDCGDETKPPMSQKVLNENNKNSSMVMLNRDGSILIVDSYGSAISMSQGDVTISAARNINLNASNMITLKAGRNIEALAVDNVQVSSVEGGMTLKSKELLQGYCSKGPVFLSSDATVDDINSSENKLVQKANGCGVVINSKQSNITIRCPQKFGILIEGGIIITKCVDYFISSLRTVIKNCMSIGRGKIQILPMVEAGIVKASNFFVKNIVKVVHMGGSEQESLVQGDSGYTPPDEKKISQEPTFADYNTTWTFKDVNKTGNSRIADDLTFQYLQKYKDPTKTKHYINITQSNYSSDDDHPYKNFVEKKIFSGSEDYGNPRIGYPYPGDTSIKFKDVTGSIATPNKPSSYNLNTLKALTFTDTQEYIWKFKKDNN